jgi:hypothetical protein
MAQRYDACTPRKSKDGKTFWLKIGSGWQSDKGMQVVLDALPIPDAEGRCVINLFEPKPREQTGNGGWSGKTSSGDLDDAIPFISSNGVW